MIPTATITLPSNYNKPPLETGDIVVIQNKSRTLPNQKIKPREMIARLRGKKFRPKAIVTFVDSGYGLHCIHIKSYNF